MRLMPVIIARCCSGPYPGTAFRSAPAEKNPGRPASCGARFITYPELFERALRASRGLLELDVGAGDRIALLLRNSIEFIEASVATAPLAASAVPINWHWRSEEIAHVLGDSNAKALVVHADLWPEIAASVPNGTSVVVVAPSEGSTASAAPPLDGAVSCEQLAGAA